MAETQSYKHHTRWLPAFHFFAVPVLLINVFFELSMWYDERTTSAAWTVLVAIALLAVAFLARIQALTAQDRLIRLEMRLRLQAILPADLFARFDELTVSQLVGLRFAGDAEMPDLVRTVLKDHTKQADIKKLIKQWVPDTYRV